MPALHLGVADVPYVDAPQPVKRGRKPPKASGATQTTGDVAERLEDKYHIMQVFYEQHKGDVGLALEGALAGALENLLMGAPASTAPFGEGASKIETAFKRFLSDKEMDRLGYPGVPTKASLLGISHRFKGKRGPPRPSFIDTAMYENSFKAWVD
jgi:hypothetical protein